MVVRHTRGTRGGVSPAHTSCSNAGESYLSRRVLDFIGFFWHLDSWREKEEKHHCPRTCADLSTCLLSAPGLESAWPSTAQEALRERTLGTSLFIATRRKSF